MNVNATRKEYARKAKVMAKIRRVYLDILKSEERWRDFTGKFKRANLRRPALQEECAGAMPGWVGGASLMDDGKALMILDRRNGRIA